MNKTRFTHLLAATMAAAALLAIVLSVTLLGGNAQTAAALSAGPQSMWGITPTVALMNESGFLEVHDSVGNILTTSESLSSRPTWLDTRYVVYSKISWLDQELAVYDIWTGLTQTLGITGYMPAIDRLTKKMVFVQAVGDGQTNHLMTASLVVSDSNVTLSNVARVDASFAACRNPSWVPGGLIAASCRYSYIYAIRQQVPGAPGSWYAPADVGNDQNFPAFDDAGGLVYEAKAGPDTHVYRAGNPSRVLVTTTFQPNCNNGFCVGLSPSSYVPDREVIQFFQSGMTRTLFTTSNASAGLPAVSPMYVELPQPIEGLVAACDDGKKAGEVITCAAGLSSTQSGVTWTFAITGTTMVQYGNWATTTITVAGQYVANVTACNRYGCETAATLSFTVLPAKLASIVIDSVPEGLTTVHPGQSYSLRADLFDAYGNGISLQEGQSMNWYGAQFATLVNNGLTATMTVKSCDAGQLRIAAAADFSAVSGWKTFACSVEYYNYIPLVSR
ncbi:MAG: hypothetical protein WC775_04655 [Patescibacteria group bacterium]|jgi:hypothetical protein